MDGSGGWPAGDGSHRRAVLPELSVSGVSGRHRQHRSDSVCVSVGALFPRMTGDPSAGRGSAVRPVPPQPFSPIKPAVTRAMDRSRHRRRRG